MEAAKDDEYQKKERTVLVIVLVFASVAIASLLVAFSYYCYIRNKVSKRLKELKRVEYEGKANNFGNDLGATEKGLHIFTFKQLHSATGGFGKSNIIGHGAFGSVYRGVLQNGRKVAIKLMDQAGKQGDEEFKVEVELLGRLHSPYLLSLIGYFSESNHKLLVYEFMANGGLQEHLYPAGGECLILLWISISLGVFVHGIKEVEAMLHKENEARILYVHIELQKKFIRH